MTIRPPDIEADITFIAAENGGRRSVALSGYRTRHDFGPGGLLDAAHEYIDRESVAPGQTAKTNMWFLAPLCRNDQLYPGMTFTVHEGSCVVGHGVVTKIIGKALPA